MIARRTLVKYHRWLAVPLAIILLLLTLSGVLLNHHEHLQLKDVRLCSPWLLYWYGVEQPEVKGYLTTAGTVSQRGTQLFLDTQLLAQHTSAVLGAIAIPQKEQSPALLTVATLDALWLFTTDGELVESMGHHLGWPQGVNRVGLAADSLLLAETDDGLLQADEGLMDWSPTEKHPATEWSMAAPLPHELAEQLEQQSPLVYISLEKLLQDIHSLRILGPAGPWLLDIAGLAFVALAVTGLMLWQRNGNGHGRRKSD